ncbi:hypothetical protein B0A55_07356 [Friedmanniomyces simplex]|uniref:SnoaL-like domain-containing protein n=1 Tax=Friedmanniomyces simplex TaxID=329884 RepID=A0A4U0X315_9PEZI|nr:hypothetical protein B0A55_07356 [Friedmanniomyces simplex]
MAYPTPPDEYTSDNNKSTTSELERLSSAFVHILNDHDFDFRTPAAQELQAHLSSNFRAHLDTYAQDSEPVTLAEQIAKWRQRAQENPEVKFRILHTMATVDEGKGRASVYVEMEVSGISDVKLQAMNELNWECVGGVWLCYYIIGMRGSSVNNGFDAWLPPS